MKLGEAVERGNYLKDQCSSPKDQLIQMLEEGKIERCVRPSKSHSPSSKKHCCNKCKSFSNKLQCCKVIQILLTSKTIFQRKPHTVVQTKVQATADYVNYVHLIRLSQRTAVCYRRLYQSNPVLVKVCCPPHSAATTTSEV